MPAEGVGFTPGSGIQVSADLVDSKYVQYVKIMDGTDGSGTVLALSGGAVPVTFSSTPAVTVTGNVASGVADSGNPVKVGGKYNFTTPTLVDGQRGDLQLTVNGFLRTELASLLGGEDLTNNIMGVIHKPIAASTYTFSTDNQMTQVTKRTSKSSPGNVFSVYVSNANAAVRYFQLHNKTSAPAGADVPVLSVAIPPTAGTVIAPLVLDVDYFGQGGHYLSSGVSWAISTTYATFTDSATANEHVVALKYI